MYFEIISFLTINLYLREIRTRNKTGQTLCQIVHQQVHLHWRKIWWVLINFFSNIVQFCIQRQIWMTLSFRDRASSNWNFETLQMYYRYPSSFFQWRWTCWSTIWQRVWPECFISCSNFSYMRCLTFFFNSTLEVFPHRK